jgi:hypothetical protein
VEGRHGRARRGLGELRRLEDRHGQLCRARQKLGSIVLGQLDEERLEELPHYPERERALQLRTARTEHPQARIQTEPPRLVKEAGLADSGWALHDQQPAAARGVPKRGVDEPDFRLPLEELRSSAVSGAVSVIASSGQTPSRQRYPRPGSAKH